jgi:antitoxin component of MazEF toxin-antitoxin module
MIQKIIKVGDSLAVTIPKAFVRELNISAGNSVNLSVNESKRMFSYSITKNNAKDTKVAEISLNFINRYKKDLESLKNK